MDVRVDDDHVPDESGQLVRGQEVQWEDPGERGYVADGDEKLERVLASEICRNLSLSVYLEAGV